MTNVKKNKGCKKKKYKCTIRLTNGNNQECKKNADKLEKRMTNVKRMGHLKHEECKNNYTCKKQTMDVKRKKTINLEQMKNVKK